MTDDGHRWGLINKVAEAGGMSVIHAEDDAIAVWNTKRYLREGKTHGAYIAETRDALVEEAAVRGNKRAQLAVEMFVHRAAAGIAAVATSLPRIDALIFTGGIGEHSGSVRSAIVGRLGALGFSGLKAGDTVGDGLLTEGGWRPAVLRIQAREDAVIARQVAALAG